MNTLLIVNYDDRMINALGGVNDVETNAIKNKAKNSFRKYIKNKMIVNHNDNTFNYIVGDYINNNVNNDGNFKTNRLYTISDKLFIETEQLFFEISDHYKMINSINTFSIISSGYDSQKIEFDYNTNKPKEYVIVNFPRSSIKKFMSTFYSTGYLRRDDHRQLARYSQNIVEYSVRIGTNSYPQLMLKGSTSSTSLENQNNLIFLNELYKAFNQSEYSSTSLSCKGIINSKNYALGFQLSDTITIPDINLLPKRLKSIKNDIVGKCVLCVRTSKISKTMGIFSGENNSSGSDIVRTLNTNDKKSFTLGDNLFELIFIEYDMILVIEGIGKFKIIK